MSIIFGGKYEKRKINFNFFIFSVLFLFTSCSKSELSKLPQQEQTTNNYSALHVATDSSTDTEDQNSLNPQNEKSAFEVHYIDVGQADATLIFSDGETMLIDGGNPGDSRLIVSYLRKHNVTHLNYIICTHAHDDHVGGLPGALSVTTAGIIYAPKTESNIKAYQNFKNKVDAQNLTIQHPTPGESFQFGSSAASFLGPINENVDDLNNTSIILKITYGETSFLFTGDAEREEEQSILNQNFDLSATVLKVGHHGSSDSTTYPFLREIMPEYGIISVGNGNSYGHPTEETLSRLRDADVKLYRTDLQGDIIVTSDGKNITVNTSKNQNIETNTTVKDTSTIENSNTNISQIYIGNKNTKKFHLESCYSLPAKKNRVYFSSQSDAINDGFNPCKNCRP